MQSVPPLSEKNIENHKNLWFPSIVFFEKVKIWIGVKN